MTAFDVTALNVTALNVTALNVTGLDAPTHESRFCDASGSDAGGSGSSRIDSSRPDSPGSPSGAAAPQAAPPLGAARLRPADVAAFARTPLAAPAALDPAASRRMDESAALRDRLIAEGAAIYGVTTGFGDRNVCHIAPEKAAELQRNLISYHLVGSGPAARADVVRATMLIRANCLAAGASGVRSDVVRMLLQCLAHDILPVIPERGSVGASGDLVPLSYLAALLVGQGEAVRAGVPVPAAQALADVGLQPLRLEPKEALGLINGTSFMSAFAVLAAADAARLADVAEVCTALTVEALLGNRGHYHPAIHRRKPHPGQLRSAEHISSLLEGSALCRDADEVGRANGSLGARGFRVVDTPIQDRYSVRCAPHVIGVLRDTLAWADDWLEVEINSVNDNPLFETAEGRAHNGGNFYGGHVGLAMDALRTAVASVGDLLDRQLACVVDEKYSGGLPAGLIRPVAPHHPEAGLHHGFKGAQIAGSALVAEALSLGMPATAFSRSTEAHNQDKVSMATIAARSTRTALDLVFDAVALHLAALCQAADLRGAHLLAPGTRAAHAFVRRHVGFMDTDRRLDGELAALCTALREDALPWDTGEHTACRLTEVTAAFTEEAGRG